MLVMVKHQCFYHLASHSFIIFLQKLYRISCLSKTKKKIKAVRLSNNSKNHNLFPLWCILTTDLSSNQHTVEAALSLWVRSQEALETCTSVQAHSMGTLRETQDFCQATEGLEI